MKTTLQRLIRVAFIAGLALAFSATTLNAEQVRGKFTLPYDTYWSGALVPAGDYTFSLDTTRERPLILYNGSRFFQVLVAYTHEVNSTATSQLIVVNSPNTAMVHVLYLSSLRTAYHFNVPEKYEVTTRILAQSPAALRIERIAVYGQ